MPQSGQQFAMVDPRLEIRENDDNMDIEECAEVWEVSYVCVLSSKTAKIVSCIKSDLNLINSDDTLDIQG